LKSRNTVGDKENHFWLAAESGYLYKACNTGSNNRGDWDKLCKIGDMKWVEQVRKIMTNFTQNIDGSFIEERQSCILWNYKNADSEHAMLFIHDLYNQIQKVLESKPIDINYGNGFLEVKPKGIRKKKLIELLLEKISKNSKIDFLFYLGNDLEDEKVFEFLKSSTANKKYF